MRVRRGAVCLATAAAALAAAGLASAPAGAEATACSVHAGAIAGIARSRVIAADRVAVVYRIRAHGADHWYACRRGHAARTLIGIDNRFQLGGAEYGPTSTLSLLRLAGAWAVVVHENDLEQYATCTKYIQYPCTGPHLALLAVAAGARPRVAAITGFDTDTTDSTGSGTDTSFSRLLASAAGGVAWLLRERPFTVSAAQPPTFTLYGCALASGPSCAPEQLATGAIDPSSLALAGMTVSWTANGQPQSARL